jgi:hypothetical protein
MYNTLMCIATVGVQICYVCRLLKFWRQPRPIKEGSCILPPVDIAPVDEAQPKWTVKPKPADGSCLFHCFADSLTGNTMVAQDLREVTAQKFINNEGDIRSFLEDGQTWEAYVAKVRNQHSWGGVPGDHNGLEAFQLQPGSSHDSCP